MRKPRVAAATTRRLVTFLAVCLAVGGVSTTAAADPSKSRVFEKYEIPFVITASDGGYNPCVGDDPLYESWGLIEIFDHAFERGNGLHSNANFWFSVTDNRGFVLRRQNAGPDVLNVNDNNGVVTFSAIGQFHLENPVTKQRYHFQVVFHITDVGGANIVTIDRLTFSDCLGPGAPGV